MIRHKPFLALCAALSLTACSAGSSGPDVAVLEEPDDGAGDMGFDVGPDAGPDAGRTSHEGRDWVQTSDFEQFEMTPGLAADWAPRELGCEQGLVVPQLEAQPFWLPEPSDLRLDAMTAKEFLEFIRGVSRRDIDAPIGLAAAYADPANRSLPEPLAPGGTTHLFVQEGEDVVVRTYTGQQWFAWDFEEVRFRGLVTAMVDYEFVDATYQRWDPERTRVLDEATGAAMTYEVDFPLEIVDVIIPAEDIPPGTHELSIFVHALPANTMDDGYFRRYKIHKGSIEPQQVPCFEPPWDSEPNAMEREVMGGESFAGALNVLPSNMLNGDALYRTGKPIAVAPGEQVTLYLTGRRRGSYPDRPMGRALMLFFDDEPLWEEPVFVTTRHADGSSFVDWRGTATVTFPEKPGVHVVRAASWGDPYAIPFLPGGDRTEPFVTGLSDQGSNALTFVVREPEDP